MVANLAGRPYRGRELHRRSVGLGRGTPLVRADANTSTPIRDHGDDRSFVARAARDPGGGRAGEYTIAFPSSPRTMVRGATYEVLGTNVQRDSTSTVSIRFSVRITAGDSDTLNSFRLLVDGVPRAPNDHSSDWVVPHTAKDGYVTFIIPEAAHTLTLVADNNNKTGEIPLLLQRQQP